MGFFAKGLKKEFETAVVNEPSVFEPLKFYCIQNLFISTAAGVNSTVAAVFLLLLCRMAAVKLFPVHRHTADYIFWFFRFFWSIQSHFENRILLKPVHRSMAGVAHFITGHE